MFLLDTNVVSEFRRARPHGAVLRWIDDIPESQLFISAITAGEIQAGIEVTRAQDTEKADEIEGWLNLVLDSYEMLPLDDSVFREWARLKHGKSDTLSADAMIAATAIVYNLTVATRNTRDFRVFPVRVINPFETH